MPHRRIAVFGVAVSVKAAVYEPDLTDARSCYSLHSSGPEFDVGVDGILDHHRHVHSEKSVREFLHTKWIDGRSRTYPKYINIEGQRILHLLRGGNFHGDGKSGELS